MIYILYMLIGTTTGLLSGLFGIGGGIIVVPTLIIIFKTLNIFPINIIMPIATATSLAAVIFTSASSAYAYNKQNLIIWHIFWKFMPGIILGIILGKVLTLFISSNALIHGFAIFLLFVAIHVYFKKNKNNKIYLNKTNVPKKIISFILSICIGILAIFFGIGGGIIMVPTFIYLGLNIRNATGTSAMCGVLIASIASLFCMITNLNNNYTYPGLIGSIYWPGALIITSFSVFFAPIGVKIAGNFSQQSLQRFFSIILVFIAIHLLIST